jgi:hypothetical protein
MEALLKSDMTIQTETRSEHAHWMRFIGIVGIITFGGFFVLYPQTLFKPGEKLFDFGYNLGLVGGVMMLIMLLYPLRKRIKSLNRLGALPNWFRWHMVLGILGPMLIVFHSTYHVYIPYFHPIGSPNSAIAMLSMLLVSGSGTFGRFFYSKIHLGLYGRQATVSDMRAELVQSGNVNSLLSIGFFHFITAGFQTSFLTWSLSRKLHKVMRNNASQNKFSSAQLIGMEESFMNYKALITSYLKAQRDAAQFHSYERLFSWWHIFHIPLVYLMVFSATYHVYAVHSY